MPPILEVSDLVRKYGDFAAVDGVSFTMQEGEVFGLLGPNGAGKTTVISVLTGVLPPTSGTARIGGHDIVREQAAAKRLNGLVPQDLALYPTLSARDNLEFFGRIYGLSGAELRGRVDAMLDLVGLEDRADDPIERYSGGMKRRANIAAGLLHQPRLLFLDEPTVGVDPQSRHHIFESVRRLNQERGMSILYTSHYMEEVELLCDRVAIMDQGRIIAIDTVKSLVSMLAGVIHVGLRKADEELLRALAALPTVNSAVDAPRPLRSSLPDDEAGDGPVAPPADYQMVKLEAGDVQRSLVDVIALLGQKGIEIVSLQVLEPNLENVFLHLTGKRLRE
ncbi:MAG: ATP-binding cassette domain-containing protein [Anaerolineae bacterium]|nr:ATP-binding cassette domain-containing protein [Anaerolineae bacterium]